MVLQSKKSERCDSRRAGEQKKSEHCDSRRGSAEQKSEHCDARRAGEQKKSEHQKVPSLRLSQSLEDFLIKKKITSWDVFFSAIKQNCEWVKALHYKQNCEWVKALRMRDLPRDHFFSNPREHNFSDEMER